MDRKHQRLILFVGPDGTGKTNISKALSKDLGIPRFKHSLEWNAHDPTTDDYLLNLLKYGGPFLTDFLRQTGASGIFDRMYPCEYAYSTVFNRRTSLPVILYMHEQFSAMGAVIVKCFRQPYEDYSDEIHKEFTTAEHLEALDENYENFFKTYPWTPVLRLDVTDHNLDRQLGNIKEFLQDEGVI